MGFLQVVWSKFNCWGFLPSNIQMTRPVFPYSILLMPSPPYMPTMWGSAAKPIYRQMLRQETFWAKVSIQARDGRGAGINVSKILNYWSRIRPFSLSDNDFPPLILWIFWKKSVSRVNDSVSFSDTQQTGEKLTFRHFVWIKEHGVQDERGA